MIKEIGRIAVLSYTIFLATVLIVHTIPELIPTLCTITILLIVSMFLFVRFTESDPKEWVHLSISYIVTFTQLSFTMILLLMLMIAYMMKLDIIPFIPYALYIQLAANMTRTMTYVKGIEHLDHDELNISRKTIIVITTWCLSYFCVYKILPYIDEIIESQLYTFCAIILGLKMLNIGHNLNQILNVIKSRVD